MPQGSPYVALATATQIAKQDFDEGPLRRALAATGVATQVLPWDDPAAFPGFAEARACVLRSTWNYVHNYDRFLAWVDACAATTALFNPAPVVRWNSHKRYLLELEARGIPIVPTRLVPRGAKVALAEVAGDWDEVVIKPAISAGSFATMRAARGQRGAGEAHLSARLAERDMLVQRYESAVASSGERAIIVIDGVPSHAVRKSPRFAGDPESVAPAAVPIADDERALAAAVLAAAPGPLLYARVDLVRDRDGRPRLMELELIEPSLFFDRDPPSADRMAAAIAARL